ncbi:MAG: hypothetical protein WCC92_11285 [Candidatus Korobacteraceae bacterium]
MSTKEEIKAINVSNATHTSISTGESCADGTMIELVSGRTGLHKPDLLLWNGRKAIVAPRSNTPVAFTKRLSWIQSCTGQCCCPRGVPITVQLAASLRQLAICLSVT